jgi:glycosyltransferase involved in cell wall biosynthesis/MoaA/NifB/PqqE/SkfB family radical SAM enzyme
MKILQVIHGYPMRYNAGSEVYTQMLSQGLAERHDVQVFTREENPFEPEYRLGADVDPDDPRINLHLVNMARARDGYRHPEVDQCFGTVLDEFHPEVVHVGHLNHLSTSLVAEATRREIPVVYTLHDYWVMCPRGQFMQMSPESPSDIWSVCNGQEDEKCARRCYARYFSGAPDESSADIAYWQGWVSRRMKHLREMASQVDLFIAPARYLFERYRDEFALPESRLRYLDYGFDHRRLSGRVRSKGELFTFGYIGTHIPAKGVHLLLEAFGALRGNCLLRIWGRPRGQETEALKAICRQLPATIQGRIEWCGEYRNQDIVADVFNRVDAIVVPSIWVENSPLVIHEAQQVRVPVITADVGGMAEYVRHEVNGLLFAHRSAEALAEQMQRLLDDPAWARQLGNRAYVHSASGDVPSLQEHVRDIEAIYREVLDRRKSRRESVGQGPWRITFDTNPDHCNQHCVMCEEHSPYRIRTRDDDLASPRVMPIELLERVVAEAVPLGLREIIPSTMGEPLLYGAFDEIIDLCHRYGLRLNLTTNGSFPGRGARAWAERIVPVASDIKISWNGATAQTHESIMVGSNWAQALENVRTLLAVRDQHASVSGHRCQVTFQLTFIETNVHELPDMVRLAIELGIDRVKGHHLWCHFDETRHLSMRRSAGAISRWNAAVVEARKVASENLLADGRAIVLDNIHLLTSEAVQDLSPGADCPFLGKEAWISALGSFSPCCAPDGLRRGLGEFGNLNQTGLFDIWNSRAYRSLVAEHRNQPLCRSCNMRRPQEGAA